MKSELTKMTIREERPEDYNSILRRQNYPRQLVLRPLWDADLSLLEKWLRLPHVAQWYAHPDDWLQEIRGRRDEFSFIKHFIAEVDGVALGFCQYYDGYLGQQHEDWYTADNPGVLFSIDYLIGEPKYLRKGYGREMVRLLGEMLADLGAMRVVIQLDKENAASRKVLEANGYIYNGQYYLKEVRKNV